jgi:hypothetical protein
MYFTNSNWKVHDEGFLCTMALWSNMGTVVTGQMRARNEDEIRRVGDAHWAG